MDTTTKDFPNHSGDTPRSLDAAWQHAQELWSSDTGSAALRSFKNLISTMPGWALAVAIVALFGMMSNSIFLLIPVAVAGFLAATFVTVKRAILSGLREHDSQQRH